MVEMDVESAVSYQKCKKPEDEAEVFRFFIQKEQISLDDLMNIATLHGIKQFKLTEKLENLKKKNIPLDNIYDVFVTDILEKVNVNFIIKSLFYSQEYEYVAKKLFWCTNDMKLGRKTTYVTKLPVKNNATSYFIRIKNLVHARAFQNPYESVRKLAQHTKLLLQSEKNPEKRRRLSDRYVALMAIVYDAGSNVSKLAEEDDETFQEMEMISDETSNPSISKVLMYGRKADAMSTLKRFDVGENMLTEAHVCADVTVSCLEIVDMIYKGVVFRLSQFEETPTDELQEEIRSEVQRALTALSQEKEDDQKFWLVLLKLRLIFSLLGIGKQCRIIQRYSPKESCLQEAEYVLGSLDFEALDHRKKMFYSVANARLHQHKGLLPRCRDCLKEAKLLAEKGKYSELKFITDYAKDVKLEVNSNFTNELVEEEKPPVHINPTNQPSNKHELIADNPFLREAGVEIMNGDEQRGHSEPNDFLDDAPPLTMSSFEHTSLVHGFNSTQVTPLNNSVLELRPDDRLSLTSIQDPMSNENPNTDPDEGSTDPKTVASLNESSNAQETLFGPQLSELNNTDEVSFGLDPASTLDPNSMNNEH